MFLSTLLEHAKKQSGFNEDEELIDEDQTTESGIVHSSPYEESTEEMEPLLESALLCPSASSVVIGKD